jgi:hypothetical protein
MDNLLMATFNAYDVDEVRRYAGIGRTGSVD